MASLHPCRQIALAGSMRGGTRGDSPARSAGKLLPDGSPLPPGDAGDAVPRNAGFAGFSALKPSKAKIPRCGCSTQGTAGRLASCFMKAEGLSASSPAYPIPLYRGSLSRFCHGLKEPRLAASPAALAHHPYGLDEPQAEVLFPLYRGRNYIKSYLLASEIDPQRTPKDS
jgi:hypothetical protein